MSENMSKDKKSDDTIIIPTAGNNAAEGDVKNKNLNKNLNLKENTVDNKVDMADTKVNTKENKSDNSDNSETKVFTAEAQPSGTNNDNTNDKMSDKTIEKAGKKTYEKTYEEKKQSRETRKKRGKIKAVIAAAVVIVIAALCAFAVYVNSYNKIFPNVRVENIELGGMTKDEAEAVLSAEYTADRLVGQTIAFHYLGDSSSISVENLSIDFEPLRMTENAYAAGRNDSGLFKKIISFIGALSSETVISPAPIYDEQALTGAISDLCAPYDTDPLGYTYRIEDDSHIVIAKPQAGKNVDMDAAVSDVIDEICAFTFGDVEFTQVVTEVTEFDLDEFYAYITSPPEDAYYEKNENGNVYVVEGKPQVVVNKADIKAAVEQDEEECTVAVQLVEPAVNAEYLQAILYEDTLGTYTTNYAGSSASRKTNIKIASTTINGLELLPGERFDFNGVVGQRTPERGYQMAPVYVVKDGETVSEVDYGGGICQVSSTIYCAVYRAGLKVISRTSHSKGVSYVPEGMDATVSWGGPEFIFENSTSYPIRLFLTADGSNLTVRIVGSNVTASNVSLDIVNDGSSVVVTRTTTNADGSTVVEVIDSNTPAASDTDIASDDISDDVSDDVSNDVSDEAVTDIETAEEEASDTEPEAAEAAETELSD